MRYTQKDIRERLGFSRDTLRFYEQRGIIKPEVDPKNGYRYYDDWQVNLLWDAKYYQGMGFSLAEVQEILQRETLGGLRERMAGRTEELERELRIKRLVLRETEHQLDNMRQIEGSLGTYRVVEYEGCLFVPKRRDHSFDTKVTPATEFGNRNAGLMAPYFWFPDISEPHYHWGYAMRASTYEALGEHVGTGHYEQFAGGPALMTYLDAGERGSFSRPLFQGLINEADARGLRYVGAIHGVLVTRVHEGERYHRYLRAYLPLVD